MSVEGRAAPPGARHWIGATAKAVLPWFLLIVVGLQFGGLRWPPSEWSQSFLSWMWSVANSTALVLPFLLFPAGVALAKVLGHSRRAFRTAIGVGVLVGACTYVLDAWVEPTMYYHALAGQGTETDHVEKFGPDTPVGIARNLRYVEANPPEQYHLSVEWPERHPPNVLRWTLHQPVAMAVFGLTNVMLGMLAAQLTVGFRSPIRRNTLFAIGAGSGIAFFLLLMATSPIPAFLRDGTLRSGVAGAWLPLSLPIGEMLLLYYLVGKRRYRRYV